MSLMVALEVKDKNQDFSSGIIHIHNHFYFRCKCWMDTFTISLAIIYHTITIVQHCVQVCLFLKNQLTHRSNLSLKSTAESKLNYHSFHFIHSSGSGWETLTHWTTDLFLFSLLSTEITQELLSQDSTMFL